MGIQIVLHDGRIGRDPNRVDSEGYGEVLATFESDRPFEEGDFVSLPDGTEVKVVGIRETISKDIWSQDLAVGEVFEIDRR